MYNNTLELNAYCVDHELQDKIVVNHNALLKVSAPYSILASRVEMKTFYRWLLKHSLETHHALQTITTKLIERINRSAASGTKIISLADPYANPDIAGIARYKEFAASYVIKTLSGITSNLVIHLCPHTSILLEKFNYIKTKKIPLTRQARPLIDALFELSAQTNITITGHQCIHSDNASELTVCKPRI
jgi:uroporphyrinogen-III decarboxylase